MSNGFSYNYSVSNQQSQTPMWMMLGGMNNRQRSWLSGGYPSIFMGGYGFGNNMTNYTQNITYKQPWWMSMAQVMNFGAQAFGNIWGTINGTNSQGASSKKESLDDAAKKCKSFYGGDSTFKDYTFTSDGQHLYARNGNESYVADSFEEMNEKLTTVKEGNKTEDIDKTGDTDKTSETDKTGETDETGETNKTGETDETGENDDTGDDDD